MPPSASKYPPAKPGALVLEPLKAAYPCCTSQRPFHSVECPTPHELLNRCSLGNLQFPAIALTWCGLTSHGRRSPNSLFMSLAAHNSEFRRWSGGVDRRICQTFAASPAEPGELPLGFRSVSSGRGPYRPTAALTAVMGMQIFSRP